MPAPEIVTENPEVSAPKKRGWPKGRKRRKSMKDENAPKRPVTGYVRFMSERRDELAKENCDMSFAEITKLVGEEWSSMSREQKAVYLDIAEKEKEDYLKQLKSYKQSDDYKNFLEKSNEEKLSDFSNDQIDDVNFESTSSNPEVDIPIFTESFLDHNKSKESELHQLNRTAVEYEQQNRILEGHVENLRNAIVKLESDSSMQGAKNKNLQSKLQYFRELLCGAFASVPLPGSHQLPDLQSIDTYMVEMCNILEKNVDEHTEFASAIYDAMSTVSFQTLDVYWNEQDS